MVVASVNFGVCKAGNASNLRVGASSSAGPCGGQHGVLGVNTRRRGGVRAEAGLGMVATGLVEAIGHSGLVLGELEVDWSDPDVQIGALGAVLGIGLGIGVPIFYVSRDERDEARLEELRALNRATKEATGEYMSDDEIADIRPPRWTDRREFVDDD